MVDDTEEKPPSIRDLISDAWDTAEQDEAPPPPPRRQERRAEDEDQGPDELSEGLEKPPGDRPRDAQGRFIREDETQEEAEAPPKQPKPKPEPQEPEQPEQPEEEQQPAPTAKQPGREEQLAQLTKNWRPEQREFLMGQPPEVQDFLIDRDREMTTAYTRKTQNLAGFINEYGPVHQMLAPELPHMQAAGYTPRMLIEGWANCERALLSGPEQAAQTLRGIAEGYRVPREVIAYAFGFDPRLPDEIARGAPAPQVGQPQPPTNGHDPNFIRDPRVDLILAERQDQQERAQIARNQNLRQAATNAMVLINQFREARDNKGNLLHPYFAEVEDHMTALAEFYGKRDGKIPPLKQLYDDAVNANPATRARLVADARRAQSDRQRATEAARGKTEQARRAASSVTGSGRPTSRTPAAPPKGRSIRASIDAAMEQLADQD